MKKTLKILSAICLGSIIPVSAYAEDQGSALVTDAEFEQINISIDSDGRVCLEGMPVSIKELKEFISSYVDGDKAIVVVVADEESTAELVLRVMNICCNYKINKVKLIYSPAWNHKS